MATPQITAWHPAAHRRSLAPSRARLRRVGVVLLVACNLVAAGTAVYGANAILTNPGSMAQVSDSSLATTADNAEAVGAFYAAVNEAIRTGDAAPIDALVAPEFDWCRPCPAHAPDLAGLKRYVAELHRASPEMRLVVDEVVGGAVDTAIVRVRVAGYPVAGAASPWGPVDTLRFAHGRIVERRNGPAGATLAEPLLGTRFDALPPAVTGVMLARLAFAAGAESSGLLSAGPTLLVVESGTLWVGIAAGGQVMRAGGRVETAADVSGEGDGIEAILGPGDGAIVPAGVRYDLRQDGPEPAVVLGAAFAFSGNGGERGSSGNQERGAFEPVGGASRAPGSLPPHVRILLSEQVDAWGPGPVRVAMGRAVLGPGARVYPPNGETLFVAVEAGTLALTGAGAGTVAAGDGAMAPPGPDRALRNAGPGLVALLVLTVVPVVE